MTPITERKVQVLRAYAETGDMRQAAARLGMSYQTLKNHMRDVYAVLGVSSAIAAYRALGWLKLDTEQS